MTTREALMKRVFLEAKYTKPIVLPAKVKAELRGTVGLIGSVQFAHQLPEIKKQLEASGIRAMLAKGKQMYPGQVLGCDQRAAFETYDKVDAFLYLGDGRFHPDGIALKSRKQVICYDPITNMLSVITDKDVEKFQKRKKGQLVKFLSATNVGVLISTKPGQNYLHTALRLREQYPDKHFYFLVYDTIDFQSLENFPFIEAVVNAACPRIFDDLQCLNLFDLESFKVLKTKSVKLRPKSEKETKQHVLDEARLRKRPL